VRYLLDTNIVSDLVRHPRGRVAERIQAVGEAAVCTSIVVAAELRFGAVLTGSPRLVATIEEILERLDILPLEPPADQTYGELRACLQAEGRPIGGNDLLIAAHTLTLGHTLVTANTAEFIRVTGLPLENWLNYLSATLRLLDHVRRPA
jgi:tRNA(fMet)-specific endonuclease VapC